MESEWKDGSLFNKYLLKIYNCVRYLQFLYQELSLHFLYFTEYFSDIPQCNKILFLISLQPTPSTIPLCLRSDDQKMEALPIKTEKRRNRENKALCGKFPVISFMKLDFEHY